MQNRVPIQATDRPPLPDFAPVPRKYRHDGWTPERQKAFIGALADTGSVSRAAAMVNMAQTNCYTLRRSPGAEEFRRAWDAALDFGVQRLKDIAFERAIDGQLSPVFVGGKLLGFRRKRNDALLMFCLRHYGQSPEGRRTTINYFSTRASAAAGGTEEGAAADAQASTTTMRTVIKGGGAGATAADPEAAAAAMNGFDGIALDAQAQAAIAAALADCAARARALEAATDWNAPSAAEALANDPNEPFVGVKPGRVAYLGEFEPEVALEDAPTFAIPDESDWRLAGAAMPQELSDWYDAQDAKALAADEAAAATKIAEIRKRPPRKKRGAD